MKIEIYHDILAKKILEKMSGEKKMVRKVERLLQERHELYLDNGKSKKNFLSQNDLDTILPFLTHLKISQEQQVYINRSRQAQRRSAQLRLATIGVVIVISGLLGFSIHQTNMANQQADMARQALDDLTKEKEKVEQAEEKAEQAEAEVAVLVQTVDEKSAKVIGDNVANIHSSADKKTWGKLSIYAQKLEEDSIYYNHDPEKLSDASGIVHRVLNYLNSISDQTKKPDVNEARSTLALAEWYNKEGLLTVINNPMAQKNLIRPGTIMFYGKSGQVYNDLSIERLLTPKPNHVIMHVGIVTDMVLDENGKVISYTLFHGRRPGKIANRTYYHTLEPPRRGYPIFGNWNQQWVAAAHPIS